MSDTTTLTTVRDTGADTITPSPPARFSRPEGKASSDLTRSGEERLVRLKRAVVGGDYQVNAKRIALKLLNRN